jgi:hypothetical protein
VIGHFPRSIVHVLGDVKLLALAKPLGGIIPIAMDKVLYWLVISFMFFTSTCVPFPFVVSLVWHGNQGRV